MFGEVKSSVRDEEIVFATYLAKYGKVYADKSEYGAHFHAFRETLKRIEKFEKEEGDRRNSTDGFEGNTTFGLNNMSDWLPH